MAGVRWREESGTERTGLVRGERHSEQNDPDGKKPLAEGKKAQETCSQCLIDILSLVLGS